MKNKYEHFINYLNNNDDDGALNLLQSFTPIEIASVIFMSQRSAISEHSQLVGDFIRKQSGEGNIFDGVKRIWD